MPDFLLEEKFSGLVAGVDEAGRGPWAGPVVAGAVIIKDRNLGDFLLNGLDDSKKLTPHKREQLYEAVREAEKAGKLLVGLGEASAEEISHLCALRLSDVEDAFRCNRQIVLYFDGTPLAHALHCPPASYASPTEAEILLGKPGRTLFDLVGKAAQGRLKLQAVLHGSQKPDGVLVGWLSVPDGAKPGTQDIEEGLNEVLQSAGSESVESLLKASPAV